MAASFQFLIHFIEQDVGKQWRHRIALRHALLPCLHHAMLHDAAVQIGTDQPGHSGVVDAFP